MDYEEKKKLASPVVNGLRNGFGPDLDCCKTMGLSFEDCKCAVPSSLCHYFRPLLPSDKYLD